MEFFMQNLKDIHGLFVGTNYHPHDWSKDRSAFPLPRLRPENVTDKYPVRRIFRP